MCGHRERGASGFGNKVSPANLHPLKVIVVRMPSAKFNMEEQVYGQNWIGPKSSLLKAVRNDDMSSD
jgi:hypothetical protein